MLWESRSQDIVDVETLSRLNQERIGLQIASIDVIQRNCDDFDVQKRQLASQFSRDAFANREIGPPVCVTFPWITSVVETNAEWSFTRYLSVSAS